MGSSCPFSPIFPLFHPRLTPEVPEKWWNNTILWKWMSPSHFLCWLSYLRKFVGIYCHFSRDGHFLVYFNPHLTPYLTPFMSLQVALGPKTKFCYYSGVILYFMYNNLSFIAHFVDQLLWELWKIAILCPMAPLLPPVVPPREIQLAQNLSQMLPES